jgi:hypothetical protein
MKGPRNPAAAVCCWLVFAVAACSVCAQAKGAWEAAQSPRAFVEGFYRWYVPIAQRVDGTTHSDFAIQRKGSAFSAELRQLLREDSEAQSKCSDIIGIDMDPFLVSGDEESYEVGKIAKEGGNYRAEIYGVRSGKRLATPVLIAEISGAKGHWFFVDFHYPNSADLLTILKKPRPACSMPIH